MSGGTGGESAGATNGAGGTIDPDTGAAGAGSTPTGQSSRGGGGGGGSAGGGAGAAGQITFSMGASLNMPMQLQGGSGGAGGTNLIAPEPVSTGSNATSGTAGAGVAGQPGTAARNYTTGTPGQDDIGGGGGEGGYGLILTGSGASGANAAFSNTGTLTGGAGGTGGFDTSGSANAVSGEGGDGGIAIDVLGSYVTLTNAAALTGGNAGTGGLTTYNSSTGQSTTTYGKGGAAIAGANLTINDSGNLTGGLNGDGTQGAAIDFTGGANTLKITGGTVTGGIIDTGSLALQGTNTMSQSTYAGISGTGSVDVSKGYVVQLTGDNTYTGGTTVEGDLTLGLHSSDPTGNIVLTGSVTVTGNLDVQVSSGSTATLGAVSGSGNFRISGNAIVASDTIANTVNDSSSNLTLTGGTTQSITNYGTLNLAPTGTTPTTVTGSISNAGTLNLAPTGAGALTISGVISDGDFQAGTVVAKSGTTILSRTNTYSGATYLQGGVIDAENASAFGTGTVYAVDPEIDYGPASGAVGKRVLSAMQANAIVLDVGTLAASDPTILKVASGFTETISGAITTGSGTNSAGQTIDPNQPLLVNGAGTLVLSGANSFSGGTTLGGSGTLELDSATAAGATSGTGTDGAVTFATGSTATLRIDVAATTEPTDGAIFYANPISNFAYGETIDLVGLQYEVATEGSPITATAALSGGTLTVTNAGFASESLTSFADAAGQSGQFTTASDGNGGTLVTLVAPPPAAPTNLIEKGTATNGGTVEITGTATGAGDANGDTITLYADGGTTAVGTGMVANGVFDITTTATFADGSHTFTATETSATTGETSASSGGATLYSFSGGADGSSPQGVLFADAAGNLLGTTTYGGADGHGLVFEIANTSGSASASVYASTPTTLYSFSALNSDGGEPNSGLIADANGNLFGTAAASGYNNNQDNGPGVVFEVLNTGTTSAPAYAAGATTVATVGNQFAGLNAGLAIDAAGDLFGTTRSGGEDEDGTVFEIANTGTPTAPVYATTPTTLYSFTGGSDGAILAAGLIADAAGDLFGTTAQGGADGNGTVFELAKNANGSYATTPTTLYSFTGQGTDGASPQAGLIADTAGDLFGTTASGGANGNGTVFELAKNANGSYATAPTTLASFGNASPAGSLTMDAAGNLYGTTGSGGEGDGTVFEIVKNANGTYATAPITLHSFTGQGSDGANPAAGLLAIAGALYGTTASGGANGVGTVFETIPTGIAPVLIAALPPTLTAVVGTASNGGTLTVQGRTPDAVGDTITLYAGATVLGTSTVQFGPIMGGANTFAITTGALADGTASFTATDTSADGTTTSPASNLLTATVAAPAPTGLHQVGTTANGGTVTIAGTGDAQGDTITLYKGTTASAANQIGTGIVGANGTFTATASLPDGSYTITATDKSADGTVTSAVSSPSTSVTLNTLYSFTAGSDGDNPQAGLIVDAAGDLFGTTAGGASGNGGDDGTVFEIKDTNGVYATTPTTLYSFLGGSDGNRPLAGLITDAAGDLFGTTLFGGEGEDGTVFEIAKNSDGSYATTPTTLHSFTGGDNNDGASPEAGLIVDGAGNLLGTTENGGTYSAGTVFEIANIGTASAPVYSTTAPPIQLASFNGAGSPLAGLVTDTTGDLFGTTSQGGQYGEGTVFEIANTSGSASAPVYGNTPTTLYGFAGGTDGANPYAGLMADTAGDLFGTTAGGGANNDGTVFEIAKNSDGTYATAPTTLVSFNGTDGSTPKAGLIADAAGNLYGTTTGGGAYGNSNGEIFELVKNADGSFAATPTVLSSFDGTDGRSPQASLLLDASGTLLGTTQNGGAGNAGTVFALTSQANQPTAVVTATAPTGLAQKGTAAPGGPIEITGTGDASGDTITLYNGTTMVGSGTAGTGGAFDVTTTTDFSTGSYTLTATDTSVDGTQVSPMSAGVTATVASPAAVAPTIANTSAPQTTTGEAPVTPFGGATVSDTDAAAGSTTAGTATDTLTIVLSGGNGGTLGDGAGFGGPDTLTRTGASTYALTGTGAAITAELDQLSFTPIAGAAGTASTTTFTLSDTSTAGGASNTDATSKATDTDPSVAPTITNSSAAQTTTGEAPVTPFGGATVSDTDAAAGSTTAGTATDTLTIALSGGNGGTLGDGAGFGGPDTLTRTGASTYTLTGTGAAITAELDQLSFTPIAGAAGTASTTTFTLSDTSTAGGASNTDATSKATDTDPAVAPTITNTSAAQTTTGEAPVTPFGGATVSDTDAAAGSTTAGTATDTLTIALSGGNGGTLGDGAGFGGPDTLTRTGASTYTLTGTGAAITAELDQLSFTPIAGAAGTASTTTFTLSDTSTAGGASNTDATSKATDTDPAVAPTITNTSAPQTTTGEAPVTPFGGATVSDTDAAAGSTTAGTATDTLTIALSGGNGGTLGDGAGFGGPDTLTRTGASTYTLTGTGAAITAELDQLSFTPIAGAAGTASTTTFTLSDTSTAGGASNTDATSKATDTDPAVAPTITNTSAPQTTTSEAPVTPFGGATVSDTDAAAGSTTAGTATDTLTIALSGGNGGTLGDGAGFGGPDTLTRTGASTYTLTGTGAAITAELDGLVFTPSKGAPNSTTVTTFQLSDASSVGGASNTDASSQVTDTDAATYPAVSGTHGTTTALQDPGAPFAGVTITDPNAATGSVAGGIATDSATIALSGEAGTLSGAGLTANNDGTYSLGAASPATLTSELDGLLFTPAISNSGPLDTTGFSLAIASSSGTATTDGNTSYTVDSRPNQSQFGVTTNSINTPQGEAYALYEGLLGRAPDQLGGEQAVADLKAGVPLDQLTQSFLASAEGSSYFTVGSSNGDFVNQLYERVLGRVDSYGEQAYWDQKLASGESRADVADAFVFSQEHTADLQPAFSAGVFVADNATSEAARLYYGVLDRSPDSTGLQNQAAALNGGTSLTTAAQSFLNSPEYAADNPTPLSDQAFVNTLFENALGRAPDQGGYWTQQLDSGAMSRAQVMVGVVESGEAQQHLAGRIENGYHLA